jgi:hypothetical protein
MHQALKQMVLPNVPVPVLRQVLTWRSRWMARRYGTAPPRDMFSEIYDQNHWGSLESASGPGSETAATRNVSAALPRLLRQYDIASMLDAPCGDFHWMRDVDLGDIEYTGADIVPSLIDDLTRRFAGPRRTFVQLDLVNDALPRVDLIFCRDCFIHLPFRLVKKALGNFRRSGAKYLLTTTFGDWPINYDTAVGGARGIDLRAAPFAFPRPLELIHETEPAEPGAAYRCLGLWALDTLPLAPG